MKSVKQSKKSRRRGNVSEDKERDKGSRVKKEHKLKKKMDWRDLLMEEEDYFLPER